MERAFVTLCLMTVCCAEALAAASVICFEAKCQFRMELRRETTMSYRTPNGTLMVRMNGTQMQLIDNEFSSGRVGVGAFVDPNDVNSADGLVRDVFTINGKFPGPTFEVLKNAEVEVIVTNKLFTEATAVHFHGLYQAGTIWMDGVPGITQHAIISGQTFTYRFNAQPAGTHWYHSHYFNQRLDGLFGMFIVHEVAPVQPYFVLSVLDWYHVTANHFETTSPFTNNGPGHGFAHDTTRRQSHDGLQLSTVKYVSGLINGRGRNKYPTPLSDFKLVPEEENVFMMCHTGSEYGYEVSIDGHMLTVTAMGEDPIVPTQADFLLVSPGECYEFTVIAQRGSFWMRAKIFQDPRLADVPEVNAIVHTGVHREPQSAERNCTWEYNCTVFNCPFKGYAEEFHRECITIDQVRTKTEVLLQTEATPSVLFLNFGFGIGCSVNARQWVEPEKPMFCNDPLQYTHCPDDCSAVECRCPYTVNLTEGTPAILVLSSVVYHPDKHAAPHPIHLHGQVMEILQAGYPEYNHTTGHHTTPNQDVKCRDEVCSEPYWSAGEFPDFQNQVGPTKDTVVVPAYGYVIVRLRVLNPGYWAMHCHQETHLDEGMRLQVYVEGNIPEIPDPYVYEWLCIEPPAPNGSKFDGTSSNTYEHTPIPTFQPNGLASSSYDTATIVIMTVLIGIVFIFIVIVVRRCRRSDNNLLSFQNDLVNSGEDEELLPNCEASN
ncbi:hypothetical protein CAPTEDRAFT_208606 [Capitella teleta]|uniref:Plastocyanin-like domain-containing protein n=1 Tax=Capitella teleta TaxID=283909 RepID=R7UIH6_CAPTE|nr:hypothetical protein CAPTEDRAFT_208606 [Capitella teleta]|eukprot:ELU05995.1 hypothetical protein CAPTEDRAFT_208606 [Capitella teleta]